MVIDLVFTEEDMAINEGIGCPNAYVKLCRDRSLSPYRNGPPFTFTPYALPQNEKCRFLPCDISGRPVWECVLFPCRFCVSSCLGNRPLLSLLKGRIDGAKYSPNPTMASEQKEKQQSGISHSVVGSSSSYPFLLLQIPISSEGLFLSCLLREKVKSSMSRKLLFHIIFQIILSKSKEKIGLAPAAIVLSRRESYETPSSTLRSVNLNRRPRPNSPIVAARKLRIGNLKENEDHNMVTNLYQAIVIARDSR